MKRASTSSPEAIDAVTRLSRHFGLKAALEEVTVSVPRVRVSSLR